MKKICVFMGLFVVLGLGSQGCIFLGGDDGGGGTNQTERDIEEYNQLHDELNVYRTEFLGEVAADLRTVGNTVFWLEFRGYDPTLHSFDHDTAAQINYSFSIGTGDDYNFRSTAVAVATARPGSDTVAYRLYDTTQPETSLGEALFDAPADEQKWWAYDVDGTTLYVVVTGPPTTLYRYRPGGTEEVVTTLESAGCTVAEFWDFGIDGNEMVFIESGRIWRLNVSSNTAEWLGNETEVSGTVQFEPGGILFVSASGPFFYDYTQRQLMDIALAIERNPYQMNETFAAAHLYANGITRYGNYFVYVGNHGVFAFDFVYDKVFPILLHPRTPDLRIDYRYPVVTENGNLFVTGLTSESGAVGADGPVYRVDLANVLP